MKQPQQGAASLIVVMILFFIISLVAAYAGRNLIFEQRTSTNQYRSTLALEAADSGLQWAMAMLNGGLVDTSCAASSDTTNNSFRQRYLDISSTSGVITPKAQSSGAELQPTCVFNGTSWSCHCPLDSAASLSAPNSEGPHPAFRVRFLTVDKTSANDRPSVVRIEVNGCASFDATCLAFKTADANRIECKGTVCAEFALSSGLKSLPQAALTARGNVDVGTSVLTISNTATDTGGVTVLAGGTVNSASFVLQGPAGTPTAQTVVASDTGLSNPAFDANRMFASIFGIWPETYWQQSGAVTIECPVAGCTAAAIRSAVAVNPLRSILLKGNVVLEGGADIGSASDPVVLVTTGSLSFTAPTNVFGLVYSQLDNWLSAGAGQVQGAVVAQGNVGGTMTATINYDKPLLTNLRYRTGSFVLVPGSWKDYP